MVVVVLVQWLSKEFKIHNKPVSIYAFWHL
ncbi:MAG: hypothetical protein ACI8QQ_003188 [Psychroserpens sp.]|jgi:hypothetical protein